MADMYAVKLKVISQKGTCEAGHKVGDEFDCMGLSPGGICLFAFNAIMPFLTPLMFGGTFPWSDDPDKVEVVCPDAANPVVFELQRIQPK
jgi:uncharacterized repeat protein (TIGR04076 family)